MKILIVGSGFNSYFTAGFINVQTPGNEIFITRDENTDDDFYTVSIKLSDVDAIKSFVKNNDIEFTIVLSPEAVSSGIAESFERDGLCIFAPNSESAGAFYSNSVAKKLMYKLKIPTPRFGIFDKENTALEYIRNVNFPVYVKHDNVMYNRNAKLFKSFSSAKYEIKKMFEDSSDKVVIENFSSDEFCNMYFITDGYNAYPLVSVKYFNENYTDYSSAPDDKLSEFLTVKILQNVVYPLIDDISSFSSPYKGIIGLKAYINNESYRISELYSDFQNYDLQTFLSLTEENILNLLIYCSTGNLSEIGNFVKMKNDVSVTFAVDKSAVTGQIPEDAVLFEGADESSVIYTVNGLSVNSAKDSLFDSLENVVSSQCLNKLNEKITEKELRI